MLDKIRVLTIVVLCFAAGCAQRAAVVKEGSDLRKKAYVAVSENKSKIIDAVIAVYREAEYRRIDLEINAALEADFAEVRKKAALNGGNVPIDQAIDGAKKLISTREKEREGARAKVDAAILQLQAIVARADTDLLIANKLNDAIESYESAGVDVSAAKRAVEEIMDLAAKNTPRSKSEPLFVKP